MLYRLPEDDGLPPKHVAVAKNCIFIYFKCGYVGFKKKEKYSIKSVDISTRYFDSPHMSLIFPPTHLALNSSLPIYIIQRYEDTQTSPVSLNSCNEFERLSKDNSVDLFRKVLFPNSGPLSSHVSAFARNYEGQPKGNCC